MYPRNAASPERLAIGAVVQISDGAVQTSGVSIKVKPQGAAASAGGGTTSYEEGIVEYLPTQAETDYTSFTVIAYKAGCIPVATTVVTSASATAGTALLAPTTHTSAVIPTVTNLTNAPTSGDLTAAMKASVNAEVDTAIADAALATAANLSAVAGYLDTEIAAILADTNELQQDWADGGRLDLILDARASQASVDTIEATTDKLDDTLEDDAGTYRFTANALEQAPSGSGPSAADIADAVWEEAIADHSGTTGSTAEALGAAGSAGDPWATALPGAYGAGSAGKIIGDNLDATVSSRATQASVDTVDGNVDSILEDTGTTLPATLSTIAGYVDTEVASVLAAVDTEVAAIKAKTDNLPAAPAASGDIPTATENADALLNRDMGEVSDTNARSPLNALRFLRNKWSVAGTTLTVTKEDDTAAAWTAEVSTQAGADPVVGSDPA